MLKYKATRHFVRTVKVRIPSETTPDAFEEASFVARFKALTRTEIEKIQEGKPDDRVFLRTILAGVEGIGDENGNPLPPESARDAVIEDLALCAAAVETFNAQFRAAKAGN